ncbi:hypothetical protein H0H93_004902 [Arthromyces matolae]|nr:hypothetical protein H0H93_004902 [Arthromyces matolae]
MLSQERQTRLESKIVCAALTWVDEEYTSSSFVKRGTLPTATSSESPQLSHLEKETWAPFADIIMPSQAISTELIEANGVRADVALPQPAPPTLLFAEEGENAPSSLVSTSHPVMKSLPSPPSSPSRNLSGSSIDGPSTLYHADETTLPSIPFQTLPFTFPESGLAPQLAIYPEESYPPALESRATKNYFQDSHKYSFAPVISEIPENRRRDSKTDKSSDLPCHFVSSTSSDGLREDLAPHPMAPVATTTKPLPTSPSASNNPEILGLEDRMADRLVTVHLHNDPLSPNYSVFTWPVTANTSNTLDKALWNWGFNFVRDRTFYQPLLVDRILSGPIITV